MIGGLTRSERRTEAAGKTQEARELLREAAKLLDGIGETAHKNALTAIVACDDVVDATTHAERLDAEIGRLEDSL